jgi:DNA-3-methyladenine glycosylase
MNAVTEREGHASAVLLRALEPVRNVALRTQGPGLLCKAMGIDLSCNAIDLAGDVLYVARSRRDPPVRIATSARIGVDYAGHWARRLLRFYERGNPCVSRSRA